MLCFKGLRAAAARRGESPGRVVTVGYFDGVHVGHRRLLAELRLWAAEVGLEPAVVTFDRHPLEVLRGRGPVPILSLRHRLLLLSREGVATTLVLSFDRELALSTAEEFVARVCVGGLGARHLLFGFDSAFGHERRGTFEHVSARARELGIEVRQAQVERIGSERVSSTVVRQAILEGDLSALERYLGRRFSVLGKVVHGDGRGRTLGFPTANIDVEGAALPPAGVYFARISRLDEGACSIASLGGRAPGAGGSPDSWTVEGLDAGRSGDRGEWGAVVNIGKRPTFLEAGAGGVVETMEAHLPDFHGDLYGSCLEVQLLARHRPERKFESAEALVREIRADIEAFRKYEAIRRPPPSS